MPAAPLTYARCRTLADDAFARGDRQSARIYTQQACAARRRERYERQREALQSENPHAARLEAVMATLLGNDIDDLDEAREQALRIARMSESEVRQLASR